MKYLAIPLLLYVIFKWMPSYFKKVYKMRNEVMDKHVHRKKTENVSVTKYIQKEGVDKNNFKRGIDSDFL